MKRISESLPEQFNVAAHFLDVPAFARRTAFVDAGQHWSYGSVADRARRAAALFESLGLDTEQRVAILLPDCIEFVWAFWGAIWLGAVPVPIHTACGLDDIRYILEHCRARVVLTSEHWLAQLGTLTSPYLRHTLLVDGEPSFCNRLEEHEPHWAPARTCREEPAFWLYTSGSTGRPKAVMHAHQGPVIAAATYGKKVLELQPDDLTYSIARLPFAYGLGNSLYLPMAVGAAAVLSDATNAFEVIEDLRRFRPTVLFGIPALYSGILAAAELSPPDLSSLRLCVSAAEQLPRLVWQRWQQTYGLEICEGIGTTELLHIFLSNRPGRCRPGSSGQPVPGYSVRIVDERGEPVAPDETGYLQVQGESLMLGYYNRLAATRAALKGESMYTGDYYRADADGYYYYLGRSDDAFKINGLWVSPFEIEEALLDHPGVLDAAVVPGRGSGNGLTEVVAFVSLKAGFAPGGDLLNSLRRRTRAQLAPYKVPKTIHILDALPRTPTGKIHRRALGELATSKV